MSYNLVYCEAWFKAAKRVDKPLSVEEAQAAHKAHAPYTVVLHDDGMQPLGYVAFSETVVNISFLDAKLRQFQYYQCDKSEYGPVRFNTRMLRQYDGDSDKVVHGTMHMFKPDGTLIIRRRDLLTNEITVDRSSYELNNTPLTFEYPAFGEYDAVFHWRPPIEEKEC